MGSDKAKPEPAGTAWAGWIARIRTWLTDSDHRSLAQRMAGTAFLIRVASAAILYLSQILLARWMGSFDFGIYVYVWTWVMLIGSVVDLGLSSATQRFIPEYAERKEPALLRGFLFGSRWLTVTMATVAAVLGLGGIWLLRPYVDRYEFIPLILACICLPLYALTEVQDGIARSYNWVNLALVPPMVVRPLLLLALIVGAHYAGFDNDATVAMVCAVIATWATAVLQLVVMERRLRTRVEPGPRAYDIRHWFSVAVPIFMVTGFYMLLTYTDILVLQHFQPPDDVAHYYAATKILNFVAFIYFAVSAAVTHRFTEYHVAGDRERLAAFLGDAVRWTFWPSLAATIVILALGKPFLWLFGPAFVEGYPWMFILAIGLLARSAVGPVERLLSMLGQQRACALAYAGAFVINLIGCLLLIPPLGPVGAAIATATALSFETLLLFWVAKTRLGFHVFVWGATTRRPA
jgi:O-antigen/teichoic acid export membrane protein